MTDDLKIITSLYAYKDNLFVANLGGGINIYPLPYKEYHHRYSIDNNELFQQIESKSASFIINMQAFKNYLFIGSTDSIHSYYLKGDSNWKQIFSKDIPRCTNIVIDNKRGYLFGVSQRRGLIGINIKDPRQPRFISDLKIKEVDILGKYHVSDLDVVDGTFFLALRDFGILRVDYNENVNGELKVYRELKKIRLRDPQDVKYSARTNKLFIADAESGFIMLDLSSGETQKISFPNEDIPVQIIPYGQDAIIKGNSGIYYFSYKKSEIGTILNREVGSMTTYFNKLYFSVNGQIGVVLLGKASNHYINQNENKESYFIKHFYQYANGICIKVDK